MKKLVKSVLAAALLGGVTIAQGAIMPSFKFDVSPNPIAVGGMFTVDVSITGVDPSIGNLTGFGFVLSPLASLTHVAYLGASIDSAFLDFSDAGVFGDISGALADPFGTTGSDVHLATLNFMALSYGSESIQLKGELDGFHGLLFATDDYDTFTDFEVDTAFKVKAVPDTMSTGLFGAVLFLLIAGRRRFRSAAVSTN